MTLISAAFAADPNPGVWLPGAVALPEGRVFVGGGGALVGADPAAWLSAEVGFTDQIGATFTGVAGGGGTAVGALGLRILLYENEWSTLGIFGVGLGGNVSGVTELEGGAGIAFEGGWKPLRFDVSLPVVFTPANPIDDPTWALQMVEAGVTVRFAEHSLRGGIVTTWAPAFSYRFDYEMVWIEARYSHMKMSDWVGSSVISVGGGARFGKD